MNKEEYIQQLKQLIKKYHPDLCRNDYLENIYNNITVKLINKLNRLRNSENIENKTHTGKMNLYGNNLLINISNQDFKYYKLGIKYYRNIHPNNFYKNNKDKTFEPKIY
jgi:hypothetical protein